MFTVTPLSRRLTRGNAWMTVFGIVDDVSDVDLLAAPEPTLYAAWTQTANVAFPMGLVLRTNGDPESIATALRGAVASVDPLLALDRIQSMETFLSASLWVVPAPICGATWSFASFVSSWRAQSLALDVPPSRPDCSRRCCRKRRGSMRLSLRAPSCCSQRPQSWRRQFQHLVFSD